MKFNLKEAFQQGKELATQALVTTIVTVDQAVVDAQKAAADLKTRGQQKKAELTGQAVEAITKVGAKIADRADQVSDASKEFAANARKALNIAPKEEPKIEQPAPAAAKAPAKKRAPRKTATKTPKN